MFCINRVKLPWVDIMLHAQTLCLSCNEVYLNSKAMRLCLDVDIGEVGIEFDTIPNQLGIGNSFQCQSYCLDVQRIHLSSLPISTALPRHLPDQWRHRAWGTRRGSSTPAMGELGPVNGWPSTTARPSTPRPPMPGGGRRSA